MARRSRISVETEDTELNMTPMLDVVFILLIFFIVTSQFIRPTGLKPIKAPAKKVEALEPGIMVGVSAQDEIWIDKKPYDFNEIRPVIQALQAETPKSGGVVMADKGSRAGTVMKVVNLMTDMGIDTRVATKVEE